MKKYLINGAMALIVGGFIVSCSHDDISQPATVDQMTKSFDEMFTELYGPIAPNHNWGFETVLAEAGEEEATEETTEEATEEKASTRSAERAATRVTVQESQEKEITRYRSDYLNHFNGLKSPGKSFEFVSSGPFKFSIIYAHTSANEEVGCYYYDPTSQIPTGEYKVKCLEDIQDIGNYVSVTRKVTNYTDFGWDKMNPKTDKTEWTKELTLGILGVGAFFPYQMAEAKTFTVEIPKGYRVGFYIKNGNDVLYTNASLNSTGSKPATYYNNKIVGFEDGKDNKTDYHDVIIEVLSGETAKEITKKASYEETTTTETREFKQIVDLGRVFVEDIATAYMKVTDDIDYNDIVFDARVWRIWNQIDTKVNGKITKTIKETNVKYQYDINLLATGGTIEEKVNGVDVHNKFGVGQAFMVNTWTSFCNQSLSGQWNTPTNLIMPKDFSYTLTYDELPIDPKDDSKRLAGINTIPIELRYNTKEMINLSSKVIGENGKTASAPYKLCLPVGTQWPIERRRIDHAYPKFVDYVSNPNTDFTQDLNVDSLYPAPTSKIQSDFNKGLVKGTTVLVSESSSSSTVDVVWDKEVTANNTSIKLYNFTFKSGQTLRFYGSGTIRVLDKNNSLIFDNFTMSKYLDIENISGSQAASLNGGTIKINGDNFKLTKIVVLKK